MGHDAGAHGLEMIEAMQEAASVVLYGCHGQAGEGKVDRHCSQRGG